MINVLIPLAQGCEELEAVTLIDLLRRAGIDVVTAGLDDKPVRAARGTGLIPDTELNSVMKQRFDLIVLPGGQPGTDNLNADSRIRQLLRQQAQNNGLIGAICAAPKVLADAGLLEGRRATSYPGSLSPVQLKGVRYEETPVLQDGNIITSRGPGTAMDFALTLIELLTDKRKRNEVEKGLVRP